MKAKYCPACGAPLIEGGKFCVNCGAKVPAEEEIKIREDGKGGLVIEAPEGSVITISDEMPKQ